MNREAIHRHIEAHLDQHVGHIQKWVRQKSVSWDSPDQSGCPEMAQIVAESYRNLGCGEVEIIQGRHQPGVWAYLDAGSPVTIHSYCMFDTRTVQPEGWSHDPWGAEIVPMGKFPKVLVGRGAVGAKGPYVTFLNALASIIAVEGKLPVNVMFLAEGDEIMGSPSYRDYVERYKDRLKNVALSYCANGAQAGNGAVNVGLGLKGMIVLELTAGAGRWPGSPAATIHSQAAGLVHSPPFRLAQALATLTDPDGTGCRVKGLEEAWAYRKPLSAEEQGLLSNLAATTLGKDWRDVLPVGGSNNVTELVGGAHGLGPLINFLYGPTFNVAGLRSGFLGAGTGTIPFIVPGSATAMLDMRMVGNLAPDEIVARLRTHLDECGFSDVELTTFSAFTHSQTPVSHPYVQAVLQTLADWQVPADVWPIQAGGGPWTVIPDRFGVPCIRGGAIGGGSGGPVNEYLVIEGDGKVAGLAEAEKYHVDLLYNVARAAGWT